MNKVDDILINIQNDLRKLADPSFVISCSRFFKEEVILYGVRTKDVRIIAKKYINSVKELNKKELFLLCDKLFKNRYNEEAVVAIYFLQSRVKHFDEEDYDILEKYIIRYLDNWSKIDYFCVHVINPLLCKYPSLIKRLNALSKSSNRWSRRASAVSLLSSFSHGVCDTDDAFKICRNLLSDEDDLVIKAYAWLLKVLYKEKALKVVSFVMSHKKQMPRLALRYLSENMKSDHKLIILSKK